MNNSRVKILFSLLAIAFLILPFYRVKALELCPKSYEYQLWEQRSDRDKFIAPKYCMEKRAVQEVSKFTAARADILPSSFDLRNEGGQNYTTAVKNQGLTGQCWAFTTTSVLESKMKKSGDSAITFSPRHIEYATSYQFTDGINPLGYNRTVDQGGNFYYSSNYLIKNIGPVKETDMPFSNDVSLIPLSAIDKANVLDINEVTFLDSSSGCSLVSSDMKKKIMANGAIGSLIYYDSAYYDSFRASYFYDGSNYSNHAVTIIGWDDNYDRTRFKNLPSANGAWLVQNSYGTAWGDNGYFYISYEDDRVCSSLFSVDSYDKDLERNNYRSDVLGMNSAIGYTNTDSTYAAYTFSRKTSDREKLSEVTFATNIAGTYAIYLIDGEEKNVTSLTPDYVGTSTGPSYKTVKFDNVYMTGSKYTVIIKYSGAVGSYHVPISLKIPGSYSNFTVKTGEGFVSRDGITWTDLAEENAALVISVSSDNADLKLSNFSQSIIDNKTVINLDANYIKAPNSLTYKLLNEAKEELSITTANTLVENRLEDITITSSNILGAGQYDLVINYDGRELVYQFVIGELSPYNYNDSNIVRSNFDLNFYVPGVDIATLKQVIGDKILVNQDGTNITSGILTSKMTVNYLSDTFKVIIKGDVTSDGFVKINDLAKLSNYLVNGNGLTAEEIISADITGDAVFKINDLAKMSKYIVDGGSLK